MAESFFLSLEFWEVKEPGHFIDPSFLSGEVEDQCQKHGVR